MKTMTNEEIYLCSMGLQKAFKDESQKLPIKINFYLQKNKNLLASLAADIEEERMTIIKNNGTMTEDGQGFTIDQDKIDEAVKELNDLLALSQELNIYTISIDSLPEDLNLTTAQMEALMFMIE